ncbi:MAG: NAD(P)-dependent oxidoreductase [Gemmatimonadales bacterium]|nr:NAD(P)-dependent oxidoreductase [Gemmatimonadales bacterium]
MSAEAAAPRRAAFLGLGAIGAPMAGHLASAYALTVWNRTAARAQAFVAAHPAARAAATPREAVAGADVVLTCLPTSHEVMALLDGPDGVAAGLAPGALFLDCTSGDPATSRALHARLAALGVAYADCPVSGGTNGAAAGTLTVMVGADADTFARAEPVLRAFGRRIEHMGPVGAGDAMKAVNNTLLALNIAGFAEGMVALAKAGVPAAQAVAVLNASSGRSFVSEVLVPERVLTGTYPVTFRLALLDKDVGIGLDVLREAGLDGPVLAAVKARFAEARAALGEDADYLHLIRLVEARAGALLRA